MLLVLNDADDEKLARIEEATSSLANSDSRFLLIGYFDPKVFD